MKQVNIETVRERMNELGQSLQPGGLSLREEFELACLVRLVELQERIAELEEHDREQMAELYRRNATIHRLQQQAVPVSVPDGVTSAIENLKRTLVDCNRYNYCSDAVKQVEEACCAAIRNATPKSDLLQRAEAIADKAEHLAASIATDNTAQQFEALTGENNDKRKPFTVVLPELINVLYRDDFSKPYVTQYAYRASDVIYAVRAAGGDVTTSAGSGKHGA